MIINLRGTSGSGKTVLARQIMALYPNCKPVMVGGRMRPIAYVYSGAGDKSLAVIGSYEATCGGCDNVGSYGETFRLVRTYDAENCHVLFEGLIIVHEVNNTAALHTNGLPLQVIALDTPIEVCVACVNARRKAKKPDAEPVNPKNTEDKWHGMQRAIVRLKGHGVKVDTFSREAAFEFAAKLLRITITTENDYATTLHKVLTRPGAAPKPQSPPRQQPPVQRRPDIEQLSLL
jgi:hypothetical protein